MFLAPVQDKVIHFYGRKMMSNKRPHIYTSAEEKKHRSQRINERKNESRRVNKKKNTWVRQRRREQREKKENCLFEPSRSLQKYKRET